MSDPTRARPRPDSVLACIGQDLNAMCEGRPIGRLRIVARLLVHTRWRAVVIWRLANALAQRPMTKALGLIMADSLLAVAGAEIQPTARLGPGLVLKHTTGLVVGGEVTAGARLTLHQNVTLGDRRPYGGQPRLGDDVTVGAGACVLGPVRVGDGAVIAANAVVLKDVPAGAVVVGNPATIAGVRNGGVAGN